MHLKSEKLNHKTTSYKGTVYHLLNTHIFSWTPKHSLIIRVTKYELYLKRGSGKLAAPRELSVFGPMTEYQLAK